MRSQNKNISKRYKLFWYNPLEEKNVAKEISIHPLLDIGKEMALFINSLDTLKHLELEVETFLKKLIRDRAGKQKSLILENIGILLEPELGIAVENILIDLSRELIIIINWPFEIEVPGTFYWDKSTRGIKLVFPELTIKQLEQ